ncbi:MAG: alpha/beta hydrolase [Nocardioides sp.]
MSLTTNSDRPGGQAAAQARPPAVRRMLRAAFLGAALVLALVIVSAGIGLALPRLSKETGGPLAWLGVLAVATGGTGAALSVRQLLRGASRRWWLLVGPALVVAGYLALWTVAQGVAASYPAHSALGSRTPAAVGLRFETVTLRTTDGVGLAAWWVPSENGAAVVLLHGAGSSRTAVLDHAAVLGTHGYGVLLLDARGHGGSGGRGMDFGWYGERDIAAALDFVVGGADVDAGRIGLVGLSMGGEEAIGAAGLDPRVRAVVAEGATNRVAADKGYLSAYGVRGSSSAGSTGQPTLSPTCSVRLPSPRRCVTP